MSGLSLSDWRAKMTFWANSADTMAIYALSIQYGLHTSVITRSKLWTMIHPDYDGTENDVLKISAIKLLYMGENRFRRIWKKAVPDQPSFYGPNFNYMPMQPIVSVPSPDNVEMACTLVQIGDNVTPYIQDTTTPLFEGPDITSSDDAMDKIVGRLDVCNWKPLKVADAMDQIVAAEVTQDVTVETEEKSKPRQKVGVKVETKWCFVKLIKLDSILFDNEPEESAPAPEKESASTDTTNPLPRLRPKNKKNRTTRRPRGASNNIQYEEAEDESVPVAKNTTSYVRNIKPSAAGPSAAHVRGQSTSSVPPSSSLPGLTVPVINPYDVDTEIDSDVQVETTHDDANMPNKSPQRKGLSASLVTP